MSCWVFRTARVTKEENCQHVNLLACRRVQLKVNMYFLFASLACTVAQQEVRNPFRQIASPVLALGLSLSLAMALCWAYCWEKGKKRFCWMPRALNNFLAIFRIVCNCSWFYKDSVLFLHQAISTKLHPFLTFPASEHLPWCCKTIGNELWSELQREEQICPFEVHWCSQCVN